MFRSTNEVVDAERWDELGRLEQLRGSDDCRRAHERSGSDHRRGEPVDEGRWNNPQGPDGSVDDARWNEYQNRFERIDAERRSRALDATRAGRFSFGVVMLLGALVLTVRLFEAWTDPNSPRLFGSSGTTPRVHELLTATWLTAFAAGILVHVLVRFVPGLRIGVSGVRSYVMFWVGAALWLPITVHWFWYLGHGNSVKQFDEWATFALAITAITHIGFTIMVGRRAAQLARGEEPTSVKNIFGWSVVLGAVPVGIVLLMIPSIVVAVTGIPIVPLLVMMKPLAQAHRDHLDAELPVARVIA